MKNKRYGYQSEKIAKEFLIKQNYTIIKSNYYSRYGEIDLICLSKNTIVFVEVKSSHYNLSVASASITQQKINKIKKTAHCYLYKENKLNESIRFDAILVKNNLVYHHLINCL